MARPEFVDDAFPVEPGEYPLTAFDVKAARSVRIVGSFRAGRTELIQDGKPVAGSFDLRAGEVVYIGHFATECIEERGEPVPSRYYVEGAESFKMYLDKVTTIGNEYRLPWSSCRESARITSYLDCSRK
jgi:hypothetical protein